MAELVENESKNFLTAFKYTCKNCGQELDYKTIKVTENQEEQMQESEEPLDMVGYHEIMNETLRTAEDQMQEPEETLDMVGYHDMMNKLRFEMRYGKQPEGFCKIL